LAHWGGTTPSSSSSSTVAHRVANPQCLDKLWKQSRVPPRISSGRTTKPNKIYLGMTKGSDNYGGDMPDAQPRTSTEARGHGSITTRRIPLPVDKGCSMCKARTKTQGLCKKTDWLKTNQTNPGTPIISSPSPHPNRNKKQPVNNFGTVGAPLT
jgi:hypothetical protein